MLRILVAACVLRESFTRRPSASAGSQGCNEGWIISAMAERRSALRRAGTRSVAISAGRSHRSFRRITACSTAKRAQALRCLSRRSMIEVANLFGLAAGAAVANFEHFDLLNPRRRQNIDDVARLRLHQRSGDRRHPAYLTATEIGLVDTDDCDGPFVAATVGVGDSRAEKDLVQLLLLFRVDHLGTLQPRRQEADAPIDLA